MRSTEYIEVFCPSQVKSQNGLWCPAAQDKLQTNTPGAAERLLGCPRAVLTCGKERQRQQIADCV